MESDRSSSAAGGKLERLMSVLLTCSALVIAFVVVRREFFSKPTISSSAPPPEKRDDWPEIAKAGRLIGDPAAPLMIVEFSDLECPFCQKFHQGSLRAARARYRDSLALRYVHFTIPGHRFAEAAAIAAECAGAQSRFAEMLDAIYARQDSLGLRSWSGYATAAGVPDTISFGKCVVEKRGIESIQSGKALGERLRVPGTPTLVVNGWKLSPSPDSSEFLRQLDRMMTGGKP